MKAFESEGKLQRGEVWRLKEESYLMFMPVQLPIAA
jgi:hypothetical protein